MSVSPQTFIPGTTIEPMRATVAELSAALDGGRLSSQALTSFYEERIQLLNPALRAVITVSKSAAAEATASDSRRSSGQAGPLEGIPVLVKDNVQAAGMPTTAGSLALLPAAPDDAFIVRRLREAGAVILGKANLSEWANFRSTHSTSGWSSVGGQCANPYDLRRN
ncbi:MAG: amidase family protein, partial [Streptosporangiaceae bacterium]